MGTSPTGVVVTGVGVLAPGCQGASAFWHRLSTGPTAIGPLTKIEAFGEEHLAAEVRLDPQRSGVPVRESRYLDDIGMYSLIAAREAAQAAGLLPLGPGDADDVGLIIGTMTGPMTWADQKLSACVAADALLPDVAAPTAVVGYFGSVIGNVTIPLKLSGPALVVTNLDAVGTDAIGYAYDAVRHGKSRIMLAGGADGGLNRFVLSRFHEAGLLHGPSRTVVSEGSAAVLGEGAAVLVLESLDSARARGAEVYAEVLGYEVGVADAPAAIARLLDGAGLHPDDLSCVVVHASGYGPADDDEAACLRAVFGVAPVPIVTSITWAVGHPLGAAGALQAATSVLAIKEQAVPLPVAVGDRPGPSAHPTRTPVTGVLQMTSGFSRRPSFLLFGRYEAS
jgi:minimal PKS ketosynthase (KS/KS alpha)